MSKNIEVLLRAKVATALLWSKSMPRKSSDVRRPPLPIEPMRASSLCGETSNSIARSGEAEIVQRVFLLPAYDVPHMVVFCGVGEADGAGGICARTGQLLADQT